MLTNPHYIDQLSTWEKQIESEKILTWLMVSEALVNGYVA